VLLMTTPIYINADNDVILDELKDSAAGTFINSGVTCTFTLYREISVDGAMTAASAVLTSTSGPFAAGDVGKAIVVRGAGVNASDLRTTIQAFTSATQVTLAANASLTVSSAVVRMSLASAKDIPMSYVVASNGKYRGTLDDAVAIAESVLYVLEVTIDAGSGRKDFRQIKVPAKYRGDT
jgi:hypothetical protein